MSRDEIIKFMSENIGARVRHSLFGRGEYLYMDINGDVWDECDYLFDDWDSDDHNGMRIRSGGVWETGWSIC